MFKIKKQLSRLYLSSVLGNLSLTGAWVAILIFEMPSGVLADVFGRKKMLIEL